MEKKPVISSEDFKEHFILTSSLGKIDQKIENRIEYIVNCIVLEFKGKLHTFYSSNADEGEVGDFNVHGTSDFIDVTIEATYKANTDRVIIDRNGGEVGLDDSFPKRWLFDDFEDELKNGKELYLKKLQDEKDKAALSKQQANEKKKQLISEAKKKLSKEELKALGVK